MPTLSVVHAVYRSLFLLLCTLVHLAAFVRADTAALYSCLDSQTYKVLTPLSDDYIAASTAYNRRLSIAPAAVVYPATATDVANAVLCAAQSSVHVAARSGGHSYAGYSLGGQNGSLVVDLSLLRAIDLQEDGETVVIQTGSRLGDVAAALYNRWNRALPHGTCPYVGVGGHAGFGGFGFPSREWGLLVDRMTGAEVVLADGSIVTTSETENSDVFWAIRGSVPSFGVVTSYTFKTLEAPAVTTSYSYIFSGSPEEATTCFLAFQDFSESAPAPLGMQYAIDNDLTFELFGSYNGPKPAFEALFQPLVDKCKTPDITHVWVEEQAWMPYLASMAGTPPRVSDCFFAKSVMTKSGTTLSYDTMLAFFSYLYAQSPLHDLSWFVEVNLYGGKYSAINAVPLDGTAFVHRDRLLEFQLYASSHNMRPPFPQAGFDFVDGMVKVLRTNYSEFTAYPNYVDPSLSHEEWPLQYYGDLYPRLLAIKKAVDPNGVFTFPQAIGEHGQKTADVIPESHSDGAGRLTRDEL